VINPKNISAITLRSGKSVLVPEKQLLVEDNGDATVAEK